jgi:hypothetical protein
MDYPSPLLVLLQTIDRVLAGHGTDPTGVTEEDKILLAAQYVESGARREMMHKPTPVEVSRLGAVLNPASRKT